MRQFETQETDSNGLPRYAVGSGDMTPGGVSMSYTWSYINPKNEALVHKQQGDKERIYLYNKAATNQTAVDEIVRQMTLASKGAIKVTGCFLHHDRIPIMVACRIGRTRWTHIVRFTDYCIGMGDRMAKALIAAIQADDGLKKRLVTD